MSTSNFKYIYLGQSVLKFQVPLDIFISINNIYENQHRKLVKANDKLIGKIKNEHSLFHNGTGERRLLDGSRIEKHNVLPNNIIKYFEEVFEQYLKFNNIKKYEFCLDSVWINEMKQHEYNPVHIHRGAIFTGLSSVMILKLPKTFGEEYSNAEIPTNGSLVMLGSSAGQFAKIDYSPELHERDFYVFPYDMRHCVYPFNGTNESRRTLAANCDVKFNPTLTSGVT